MSDPQLTQTLLDWSAAFVRRSMHDFLRFTRREGLSMVQMNVLMYLHYHGSCEITGLLDTLEVSKSAAGQLVERMGQQGLVERRTDPDDRRARRVSLTGKGRELVEASIAARQAWMADLLEHLPEEERPAIARALGILAEAARRLEDKNA
jgi:DNA-binding MarR family transcriptional regulator